MWRSLLTLPGSFGIVNFPKLEGVADAFTKPHLVKRAVIFVSATNALQVHPVDVVIYWRGQRPDVRETQAAFKCRGALFPPFFVQKSQNLRCSILRFFLSSRYLRLRHRLLSLLITLAGCAGATLTLGALLMLPVVYLWEVR